jgi:UTP--glucose-1-phosphate uridylyltransferase
LKGWDGCSCPDCLSANSKRKSSEHLQFWTLQILAQNCAGIIRDTLVSHGAPRSWNNEVYLNMKVRKAVITAAGRHQRTLPLQTLIDRDGVEKPILRIILEEVFSAPIDQACVVIAPGDEKLYAQAAGDLASMVRFVEQPEPRGYGHAIQCARPFTANEPFLHLVGDHVYLSTPENGCARQLVALAERERCLVSSVQPTRENQLGRYGAIGGQHVAGNEGVYRVETVREKPTPTEAEEHLIVAGLRAGHYLCFFGMHVLTPAVMDLLERELAGGNRRASLSAVLDSLARREQYLALEETSRRYDVGVRYGLLTAQMALALAGRDRQEVLAQMLELLAVRAMESTNAV